MNATSNEAVERDVMEYDFLIVGAGPAGLACAIRLKQLKPDLNICVLEKGATVGAHSLSGAVMEPGPLDQLAPEWRDAKLGVCVPVVHDELRILTRKGTHRLPVPPQQRNHGNFIVSLGLLTAWLAQKAEGLGVDVFAGFAAAAPLFDEAGAVAGVCISDMGLEKNGEPGPNYAPGPEIRARATILAEGCRGSLTKQLIKRFKLDAESDPQTYGLGFKELWQLPAGRGTPGLIQHSVGWPLDNQTYGGSFIYHLDADRVYVGFVVGLDYIDPMLKPFEVFQQFKHHPSVKPLFEGGEILVAGARTIAAGGWQSLPKLEMPGAMIIGDAGGTLNFPKIKGIHQAIRSGALAAEHLAAAGAPAGFDALWRASPGGQELRKVRNFKPGFKRGLWFGIANSALEVAVGGRTPWTLHNTDNAAALRRLDEYTSPDRGWADRSLPPRDRLASVFFAATTHDEAQPVHLKVANLDLCATRCRVEYDNPCTRYCPVGVYEMIDDGQGGKRLQINSANCVHCKACDIKDPYGNITWTTPEGGSGPNYQTL
ncbi:MAG TPA: electron transfer flavoprotein-ubiquinone oxidoreductase [Steroidobacteraceae bacterium]|nr:electron transfer flavoprotein-ubiquinone oxidoreductase [Steroidobacteraceae bacterium]HQW07998.1 electron transfer flavoprotein-ubiquinone oxidoreductase [Steroidobacteraceae bacterium]HQX48035.1 electron transfer flavoprotein-ubiquinone oxidoreductase [Steroidobacteraceae bacterium]HQX77963.1 electron transfer flavoprotein-ubiquinone oxidoreductase [Steroidobacteraceae bacterium]HQZ81197.1 electron transfer flavoprotein-ubiquinone oxidoreductase [Steroidobacteraceae bacterium]